MTLRVLHWNTQTLKDKEDDLDDLLNLEKVDVALLSETRVRHGERLAFEGYSVYTKADAYCNEKKCTPYRGLIVMIRKDIEHNVKRPKDFTTIQALGVEILKGKTKLRIYAVYRPPSITLDVQELRSLISSSVATILAGDMNAKHPSWNSLEMNPAGRKLRNDADEFQYKVAGPPEPTYYGSDSIDTIDLIIHNLLRQPQQKVLPNLGSDHRPVVFNVTPNQLQSFYSGTS